MDKSTNSSAEDDHSESWSIVDENISDDGIDFEVVRDLFENNINDADSASTDRDTDVGDLIEDNIEPNITTVPNAENEEHFNDANEEEVDVLVDFNPSNNSLRKFHVSKGDINADSDVEKNVQNKTKKRKKHFYKCPFVTGVSLGTLLTVCGLSLILKSSNKNVTSPDGKHVSSIDVNSSLADVLDDHIIFPSIFEEDRLLRKYCPNKFGKDWLKHRNMKTKLLKRIDRKMKQQMRDYDAKPLPNKTEKQKNEFIGPLNKEESLAQQKEENETHFEINFCKQRHFNDTFIFQGNTCPAQDESRTATSDDEKQNAENSSTSTLNRDETEKMQMHEENSKQTILPTGNEVSNNLMKLEESYHKLQHTFKKYHCRKDQYEGDKPKDIVQSLENKISKIKLENVQLGTIIKEQEKLIEDVKLKLAHKKKIFEKRNALQTTLERHLDCIKHRRTLRTNISNYETNEKYLTDMSKKVSNKILDELITSTIKNISEFQLDLKNNHLQNNTETINDYFDHENSHPQNDSENNNDHIDHKNDHLQIDTENNNHIDHKPDIPLAKPAVKECLDIYLQKQRVIEELAKKMEDEEHSKKYKQPEKCDPKKAWIRKRNEIY